MVKKCLALLLTVIMVCSMIPSTVFAKAGDVVTITVVDQNGNLLQDAVLSVSRVYLTVGNNRRTQTVQVTNNGDGTFSFTHDTYYAPKTLYYTMTASCENSDTVSQQVDPDTLSVLITLDNTVVPEPDKWVQFDVYYIATGRTPASFTGAGQPQDYGPSGNDVPLVTINVNITKLKSAEYRDRVVYEENKNGNSYHFIPAGNIDNDQSVSEENKRALIKPFWKAVVDCMDEESAEAFEATGLSDSFMGYVLKNQGSIQNPDNHCDGILTVEPPVYIVEMNDRGSYFGGFANDKETAQFTKLTDVLSAYNDHFKQSINWVDNDDGTYSGSYIEGKYQYYLKISQTNYSSDLYNPVAGSEIYVQYEKQTDQYYLATFDAETVMVEQIEFTVSYTDGMNNKVFNAQVSPVAAHDPAPAFGGEVIRENYVHVGWMLQGGDGKVLSQEDILNTYRSIDRDLTFVAVYELKPATFAGVVEVILNGSYEDGAATGERVDIADVRETDTALAVSTDGVTFIPLAREARGVYAAHLENGTYQIYYTDGESYELTSEQHLDISDAPRTRYLFFNTVEYDVNGGQNGPDPTREVYRTGDAVDVSATVPTKDGYRFLGWQDESGARYQSGEQLTAAIGQAYTLTAQWEKIVYADVDVTVILDHTAEGGGKNTNFQKDLDMELTYRPLGSDEDYVEVVGRESVRSDWYADGTTVDDVTTVTYESLFTLLPVAYEFGANVFLSEYSILERTVTSTSDTDGNVTYHVTVRMKFNPDQYTLQYGIEERIDNDALVPTAVDIKVLSWYDPVEEIEGAPDYTLWYPIFEHVHNSHDALFTDVNANGDRIGFGSYNVWGWENKDQGLPYYYRIGTVGFTLPDGTELTAATQDGVHFTSVATADGRYPTGAYTAVLEISGGNAPAGSDLVGAYFENDIQNGSLTLVIEAHPYNVTLDPNGGTLHGSTDALTIADQFTVPHIDGYVPTRGDAYMFDEWVLLDENGQMTDGTVAVGEALTRDITLVATWKEPLTVKGLVTVGATYEQIDENGFYWYPEIYEEDRPETATVLLQKIDPNGYTETVRSETLTLEYTNEAYYYLGRPVGVAEYAFDSIPDDGTTYRIQMLLPNYVSFFQNEPEAANEKKKRDYPTYNETDYVVVWGENDPTVGHANIHNHFDPEEFDLTYTVDASAIGQGFRPDSAEILVTGDGVLSGNVPSEWAVISQMKYGGDYVGDEVTLAADGIGHGATPVWISDMSGARYYQYGIRLHKVTADGETAVYTTDLPYTVAYEAPAHYHYGAQSQELKAVLTPNTYAIRYELGGGTVTGEYPAVHTWSYSTPLDMTDPTFRGFEFDGWYLDADFSQEAPAVIGADVAQDITLYAKWVQVMDVVDLTVIVRHVTETGDTGLTGNYNKTLHAQLTSDLRINEGQIDRVFADVEGCAKEYRNGIWHIADDDVTTDVFQVPAFYTNLPAEYDYAVNVSLDGYYVTNKTVSKTAQPDGSTLHKVVVELQFNPELLMLDFYVRVEEGVDLPVSAEVKVTCWYDSTLEDVDWQWFRITQHAATTVTVTIDPATRIGYGAYPVWMWYNKEENVPYHYRIEVLQLNMADGTSSHMTETDADVMYHGGGYHAEIETAGGRVPTIPDITATTDLEGVYGVVGDNGAYVQQGTVGAVIGKHDAVVFHANNEAYLEAVGTDTFRAYYHDNAPQGSYHLNADGSVDLFYDIPTFDYATHNDYIFKGWYMHPVLEDEPFDWSHTFEHSGDVYAHWITVGDVAQEQADTKEIPDGTYREYDLTGVQIRDKDIDEMAHYGNPASGLRFISVLSERVYGEINAITGTHAEYGFVMAKTSTLLERAGNDDAYTLQYKAANVNGVDTNGAYGYVQNIRCDGVVDHYAGETYRLYTAVITYNGMEGTALEAAYATDFTARSYIRYTDANGLLRTYYNNYTGQAPTAGGCTTSFADVQAMMGA